MIRKLWSFISNKILGRLTIMDWFYFIKGKHYALNKEDWSLLFNLLRQEHFIILTRRKSHVSTYFIDFGHWLLTCREWIQKKFDKKYAPKMGYWTHACMNLEGDIKNVFQIEIAEAIGRGSVKSSFFDVFDCDSVCLLQPVCFNVEDWQSALDEIKRNLGRPYDNFFNIVDDSKMSCVELVYDAIKAAKKENEMKDFVGQVNEYKNLTADFFYNSKDFKILFEVRR